MSPFSFSARIYFVAIKRKQLAKIYAAKFLACDDVLWVAGIACDTFNFASTVTTDGAVAAGSTKTFHTDTKDANLIFSVGDVIQEVDNTIIGTIEKIGTVDGTDVDITVNRDKAGSETPAKVGCEDGVEIYHRSPIKLELHFEK